MRFKLMSLMATLLLLSILISSSQATLIVDTGDQSPGSSVWFSCYAFSGIAGEFTISNNYIVNSIQSYFVTSGSLPGRDITAVIYKNGGNIPSDAIYTSNPFFFYSPNQYILAGPTSLNWYLPAGTYWVAFESKGDSGYVGMACNAPNPLMHEANNNHAYDGYYNIDHFVTSNHFAFKIDATPVPLPPSVLLFGSGLIGLIGLRRFRRA